MKCLFISSIDVAYEANIGGGIVSAKNLTLLKEIFLKVDSISISKKKGVKYIGEYMILPSTKNKIYTLISNIFFYAGCMTAHTQSKICELIKKNEYNVIFLDTSNYGKLAYELKKRFKDIKIITFFHNIESVLALEQVKKENFLYFIKLIATYINEKLSTKFSDNIIMINSRDYNLCKKIYLRIPDLILSGGYKDLFENNKVNTNVNYKNIKVLFVGSLFGPNIEGIKWFIKNVMPYINVNLQILGKNMESKKKELENGIKRINVIGSVASISDYYYDADIVVMPIFYGSGMKIKTVEALMYGKTIFATDEALEGYDKFKAGLQGERCNTAKEFIEKINIYSKEKIIKKYNEDSRYLFLNEYSFVKAVEVLRSVL